MTIKKPKSYEGFTPPPLHQYGQPTTILFFLVMFVLPKFQKWFWGTPYIPLCFKCVFKGVMQYNNLTPLKVCF